MSRAKLLEEEKAGNVQGLNSCRKKNQEGKLLLEPGSLAAVASVETERKIVGSDKAKADLGIVRIACMLTGNGNLNPLVRKLAREAMVRIYQISFYQIHCSYCIWRHH